MPKVEGDCEAETETSAGESGAIEPETGFIRARPGGTGAIEPETGFIRAHPGGTGAIEPETGFIRARPGGTGEIEPETGFIVKSLKSCSTRLGRNNAFNKLKIFASLEEVCSSLL